MKLQKSSQENSAESQGHVPIQDKGQPRPVHKTTLCKNPYSKYSYLSCKDIHFDTKQFKRVLVLPPSQETEQRGGYERDRKGRSGKSKNHTEVTK